MKHIDPRRLTAEGPQRTLHQLLSPARISSDHIDEQVLFDGQHRSAFECDGDKIAFTDGFRALADHTQVHDRVAACGNHRNRLTHSIEVSRVGRSLGIAVGERMAAFHGLCAAPTGESYFRVDPAEIGHVVQASCLAHDLGNPPFGHDGEDAISAFFRTTSTGQKAVAAAGADVGAELCMHEGNAQGFRMITRSMGWRRLSGLNLTAATLGAFGKYPFPLKPGGKKYGLHRADLGTMEWVAEKTGMRRDGEGWFRHPLAWLMEAADDICYLTVDIEDAAWLGMVDIDTLCDFFQEVIGADEIARGRQLGDDVETIQYLRSRMIKALINSCVEVYADIAIDIEHGTLKKTEHGSGILAHTRHAAAMASLRAFSSAEIYKSEATQLARKGFRQAMFLALEQLVSELLTWLSTEDDTARISERAAHYPALASLPHARLNTHIPSEARQAFPWLLDQVTLMSDAQMLSLSQRSLAG